MKYGAIDNKEILQKLINGILNRAAVDIAKGTDDYSKLDAIRFIKGEYCELMCYVANKEYTMLLAIVQEHHVIPGTVKKRKSRLYKNL